MDTESNPVSDIGLSEFGKVRHTLKYFWLYHVNQYIIVKKEQVTAKCIQMTL